MSLYLGTNLVSGVAKVTLEDFVDAFYPVGSVFIGTTSTCPLADIKGTWTLKSSGVVTSVNTNVPVKGNGTTLGLTENSHNGGLQTGSSGTSLWVTSGSYGKSTGSTGGSGDFTYNRTVGLTTDATKSGVVGTVTRTILSVNIWERTA